LHAILCGISPYFVDGIFRTTCYTASLFLYFPGYLDIVFWRLLPDLDCLPAKYDDILR